MLTHDFDMINFLTGETLPETVHAIAHCYVPEIKEMDDVDTVIITLKYASGLLATVDTSRVAAYGYDQVGLFGDFWLMSGGSLVDVGLTFLKLIRGFEGWGFGGCSSSWRARRGVYRLQLEEHRDCALLISSTGGGGGSSISIFATDWGGLDPPQTCSFRS